MESAIAAPSNIVQDEYFRYLCDLVRINDEKDSYFLLASQMHKKAFYGILGNDDDRGLDGRDLRRRFMMESSFIDYEPIDGPCTFFEFLIGLAFRMAFLIETSDDEAHVWQYFHELLNNCGLSDATDNNYYTAEFNCEYATAVMDRILERRYARNGRGGLFPLEDPDCPDQREQEIWYQMSAYLNEREGKNE